MFGSVLRLGFAMIGAAAAGQALAAAPHPTSASKPAAVAVAKTSVGVDAAHKSRPSHWPLAVIGVAAIGVASRTNIRKFARFTV